MADIDELVGRLTDRTSGRYVNPGVPAHVVIEGGGAGPTTERLYVSADAFMDIQAERDRLRKTLAFINAWRLDPDRTDAQLDRLLADAGFERGEGRALLEMMAQFRRAGHI